MCAVLYGLWWLEELGLGGLIFSLKSFHFLSRQQKPVLAILRQRTKALLQLLPQLTPLPWHQLPFLLRPFLVPPKPEFSDTHIVVCSRRPFVALRSGKWSSRASFFSGFRAKAKDIESLKQELLAAIQPLDRGADATTEDQLRIDEIAKEMEGQNKIKNPLNSNLLNGKWELLYTTSQSVLKTQRPKLLRPNGKIYQAINVDTLRAQNMETWPFFNQATANLVPLNSRRVAVKFDLFKISGLVPIKSPGSGRGQLEITYLDEELRISRGDRGNLFILKMVDPSYKVPL